MLHGKFHFFIGLSVFLTNYYYRHWLYESVAVTTSLGWPVPMALDLRSDRLRCIQPFKKPLIGSRYFIGPESLFSRLCRGAILMALSFWVVSVFNHLCFSRHCGELPPHTSYSSLSDLDHFKVHTRSAVSVREGQGVVLLCGTPTSSGGEPSPYPALESAFERRVAAREHNPHLE